MKGIVKKFPGVIAVNDVDFDCQSGEIHALLGENGAGKTTLMNVLGGLYRPNEGSIFIDGNPVTLANPIDATNKGIGFIHQEFNLLPNLTVAENIFISREITKGFCKLDKREMVRQVNEICATLGYDLDPGEKLGNLSLADQQLCEITRAVMGKPRILIMDEPTAALADDEVERLFEVIGTLKEQGVCIIYITHRLDEVLRIADVVTVLKDGKLSGMLTRQEVTKDRLINLMIGRTFENIFPSAAKRNPAPPILEIKNVSIQGKLATTNLAVEPGEILGFGGLEGQGQRTLARALFRDIPISEGNIILENKPLRSSIKQAVRSGIGYVTHDRRGEGLILHSSVLHNSALASLWRRSRAGFIKENEEKREMNKLSEDLDIRCRSIYQSVQFLSGGNQQKVMLARWLMNHPKVLIFDEPTKGVDVGARVSIYKIIRDLADLGVAIILLTSDMMELIGLSDRIVVFYEGAIVDEFLQGEATEEKIMRASSGLKRGTF